MILKNVFTTELQTTRKHHDTETRIKFYNVIGKLILYFFPKSYLKIN